MNPRRIAVLIVAIVVAAVASLGLFSYVRNLESSSTDGEATGTVWMVKEPIAKGTDASEALAQGLIVEAQIPQKYRPANAVADPTQEIAGLVAVFDLPVNEIIKDGTFVPASAINTGITDRLDERSTKDRNMATVSFSVDEVKGVGHQVQPGDYVNILMHRPFVEPEGGEGEGDGGGGGLSGNSPLIGPNNLYPNSARYIYQKSEVLSVGQQVVPDIADSGVEEGEQTNVGTSGLITLAVPPESVQLILSLGEENIYLSLVSPDYVPKEIPEPELNDPVLPGEDDSRLTPTGPPKEEDE